MTQYNTSKVSISQLNRLKSEKYGAEITLKSFIECDW